MSVLLSETPASTPPPEPDPAPSEPETTHPSFQIERAIPQDTFHDLLEELEDMGQRVKVNTGGLL